MKFCDKLIELRRERGYSQEQLADLLDVSRQSVSKWEANQTMPELAKLITLSQIFDVSLDYLLKEDIITRVSSSSSHFQSHENEATNYNHLETQLDELNSYIRRPRGFEYKSKTVVLGLPLVHVCFHHSKHRFKPAKGIIAIGNIAFGFLSIGLLSFGALSIGALSIGLLALGAIALGVAAFGSIAIGILAGGAIAIGIYAMGAMAIGKEIAIGAFASGNLAIGDESYGTYCYSIHSILNKEMVRDIILTHYADLPKFLLKILTLVFM